MLSAEPAPRNAVMTERLYGIIHFDESERYRTTGGQNLVAIFWTTTAIRPLDLTATGQRIRASAVKPLVLYPRQP